MGLRVNRSRTTHFCCPHASTSGFPYATLPFSPGKKWTFGIQRCLFPSLCQKWGSRSKNPTFCWWIVQWYIYLRELFGRFWKIKCPSILWHRNSVFTQEQWKYCRKRIIQERLWHYLHNNPKLETTFHCKRMNKQYCGLVIQWNIILW